MLFLSFWIFWFLFVLLFPTSRDDRHFLVASFQHFESQQQCISLFICIHTRGFLALTQCRQLLYLLPSELTLSFLCHLPIWPWLSASYCIIWLLLHLPLHRKTADTLSGPFLTLTLLISLKLTPIYIFQGKKNAGEEKVEISF